MGFNTHHQNTQSGLSTRRDTSYKGNFGSFGQLRCPSYSTHKAGHSNSYLGYGFLSRPLPQLWFSDGFAGSANNFFQETSSSMGSFFTSTGFVAGPLNGEVSHGRGTRRLSLLLSTSTGFRSAAAVGSQDDAAAVHENAGVGRVLWKLTKFADDDVEFRLIPGVDLLCGLVGYSMKRKFGGLMWISVIS